MLLEQEIASIIHFLLDATGKPNPYYHAVPEQFTFPAAYFPSPEITGGGETFLTYRLEFSWYITFHDETSEGAYALAHNALSAIMRKRSVIPLILPTGEKAGGYVRIDTALAKQVDIGVYQLELTFVSRRPYDAEASSIASGYVMNLFMKSNTPAPSE